MKKIIITGLFLLVLLGCKQVPVRIIGEIEKPWKSDSVEIVLPDARTAGTISRFSYSGKWNFPFI